MINKLYLESKYLIYHGTDQNVDFLEKGHENTYEYYGDAIYFSDNLDIAKAYGKNVWVLKKNKIPFIVVNANYEVIRNSGNKIKSLIEINKNIKINNVRDNPRTGMDFKLFPYNQINSNTGKHKYFNKYVFHIPKRKEIDEYMESGLYVLKAKGIITYLFSRLDYAEVKKNLTDEEINLLRTYDLDDNLFVQKGTLPEYSTTYIITDNKLLKEAKRI